MSASHPRKDNTAAVLVALLVRAREHGPDALEGWLRTRDLRDAFLFTKAQLDVALYPLIRDGLVERRGTRGRIGYRWRATEKALRGEP